MASMIAACGLDCGTCPAFTATMADDRQALAKLAEQWGRQFGFVGTVDNVRCHGCKATDGVRIGNCSECKMSLCSAEKGYATCAECGDYPCERLAGFQKDCPDAKARLDALVRRA